jgi:ABC-2 type transport system ATP-binding protein
VIKRYGALTAVDGLDLDVARGECFGLLGPNGAGKTTSIEILEGLLTADAGDVQVLGRRWQTDARWLRTRLGIQLQETQLAEKLSVEETLRLFRSFYPDGPTVDELLAIVELDSKRTSWVGKLSGGQKQRLSVACAMAGRPDLLFLDEPTTGLDPQSRRQVWEIVNGFKARGHTVLLTTHYMDEAERLCDRIAIVDHGKVIALGTPAELIASLGGEHVIEFTVEQNGAGGRDLVPVLSRLPAVTSVRQDNGAYTLSATELHLALPELVGELARQESKLSGLVTRPATLEDVFVKLAGRHLTDEEQKDQR